MKPEQEAVLRRNRATSSRNVDQKLRDLALHATSRFGRGSIALQEGRILTPDRQKVEKEEIRKRVGSK